ncbi:tRNA (guanine(37)-N1)-methyltransferase 1 [Euphorbia peplus]|nr:tRNA (guanine(37)-N1)-methyltransferase 1 [Euphorbia peplus]
MVTKLVVRPNCVPLTILKPSHIHKISVYKCSIIRSLCSRVSSGEAKSPKAFHYGPSLSSSDDDGHGHGIFSEEKFSRVYEIAALRVPAKDCFSLESRLRGHLLNWPRIPNIARLPGDDIEPQYLPLFGDTTDPDDSHAHQQTTPVLYRDKLAKDFNTRGFFKFRNLAKISRPPNKKRKQGDPETPPERKQIYLVEVVDEDEEYEDWKGLLGDDFKGTRKWIGSTRLLLLDHTFTDKPLHSLPQAIQTVFQEALKENSSSAFELVRCKLTLFYDYWQMNQVLEALLPKGMIVPSGFETIGHIVHLNLRDAHLPYKKLIAKVVLDKNKPKIQTVVNKIDAIHNDYRTMQLEVLAGNHSLVTMLVENGLRFHVDLAKVYWNSRLATERQRLLDAFTRDDIVCDVFSGVGPITLAAARKVKRVYANDLNPCAIDYLERNSALNKLERKIKVFNMDGRRFINAMFSSDKGQTITQVVMNLPNDAAEYLDAFRGIYKDHPKHRKLNFPTIHVYGFSKARDPEFDFHERIRIALAEVAVNVEMRRVRLVAPGKWMLCGSFRLPESVAYANITTYPK